jgi:hypothetical protein
MDDGTRRDYQVWDKLFDLLYPCDEQLTDEEAHAELERLGIDMEPAFQRLHKMMEVQRARVKMASAKEQRATFADRLRDVVAPKVDDLRNGIQKLIEKLPTEQAQLAFHKLEGAASEEDLQSLFDDLERLKAMEEFGHDSES